MPYKETKRPVLFLLCFSQVRPQHCDPLHTGKGPSLDVVSPSTLTLPFRLCTVKQKPPPPQAIVFCNSYLLCSKISQIFAYLKKKTTLLPKNQYILFDLFTMVSEETSLVFCLLSSREMEAAMGFLEESQGVKPHWERRASIIS